MLVRVPSLFSLRFINGLNLFNILLLLSQKGEQLWLAISIIYIIVRVGLDGFLKFQSFQFSLYLFLYVLSFLEKQFQPVLRAARYYIFLFRNHNRSQIWIPQLLIWLFIGINLVIKLNIFECNDKWTFFVTI